MLVFPSCEQRFLFEGPPFFREMMTQSRYDSCSHHLIVSLPFCVVLLTSEAFVPVLQQCRQHLSISARSRISIWLSASLCWSFDSKSYLGRVGRSHPIPVQGVGTNVGAGVDCGGALLPFRVVVCDWPIVGEAFGYQPRSVEVLILSHI